MDKQEHNFFLAKIRRRALFIQKVRETDYPTALLLAHQVEHLLARLHQGEVRFSYQKQDGTTRRARGTLTGYEYDFKRPYRPTSRNTFVVYYDLDACGWRTFQSANLRSVDDD